jgi:hypothetical protein
LDNHGVFITKPFRIDNWLMIGAVSPFYHAFEEMFNKAHVKGQKWLDVFSYSTVLADYTNPL